MNNKNPCRFMIKIIIKFQVTLKYPFSNMTILRAQPTYNNMQTAITFYMLGNLKSHMK